MPRRQQQAELIGLGLIFMPHVFSLYVPGAGVRMPLIRGKALRHDARVTVVAPVERLRSLFSAIVEVCRT